MHKHIPSNPGMTAKPDPGAALALIAGIGADPLAAWSAELRQAEALRRHRQAVVRTETARRAKLARDRESYRG